MNPTGKLFERHPVLRLLAGALLGLYAFSRFLPCLAPDDYLVNDSLENSWTQALHVAYLNHFQFGSDLIFTYGPWGFLARGWHPQTFPVAAGAWLVLTLVFLLAGWRVARGVSNNRLLAGVWLAAFTAFATLPPGEDINTRLMAWCVLLLLLHFFVEERALSPLQVALTVSLGWLSLVKFTGLLESGGLVALIAADNVFRQRRFPWIVPLWVSSVIFFWLAAGQALNGLGSFLINSWQITSGYTEAMMLGSAGETSHAAGFVAIAVALLALLGWLAWTRQRFFATLPVAGFGVILFLMFKLGYVRNDRHEMTAALALPLAALALLAASGLKKPRAAGAVILGLLAATLFTANVFSRWLPGNGLAKEFAATFHPASLFAPVAAVGTRYLPDAYEKNLAAERRPLPLPALVGSVDIYSYEQNALFAHGAFYRPRPVIQSYSAYTPELARANATHLRTPRAADHILFAIQPLDGHFPALDDGLSWPELLTRYDLENNPPAAESFLQLTRAAVPRAFRLTPLANFSAHFGEPMALPAASNGLIWAEMEIKKTLAGSGLSLLYKPPSLWLDVALADGSPHRYRLVPGMAAAGFLLSPVIADNQAFAALATAGGKILAAQTVASLMISAAAERGSTNSYQPEIYIRFYRLDFPQPLPASK